MLSFKFVALTGDSFSFSKLIEKREKTKNKIKENLTAEKITFFEQKEENPKSGTHSFDLCLWPPASIVENLIKCGQGTTCYQTEKFGVPCLIFKRTTIEELKERLPNINNR